MPVRNFHRAMGAISASALIVSAALARPTEAGFPGVFDEGGLVLPYSDGWRDVRASAADEQVRAEREYERCLNPAPKVDLGRLGSILLRGGNVRDFRRFTTPPRRLPVNRSGCERPSFRTSPDELRIVEVPTGRSAAHGSGATLLTFTFRTSGGNLIARPEQLGGRCVAIVDAANRPVPVRSMDSPDPYSFRNPFDPATDRMKVAIRHVEDLREQLARTENDAQSAGGTLASLANYNPRADMCATPPRAPYPARPNVMADAAIEDQAAGSCVDLMMNRHDPAKVMGALRSIRQDWMIEAAKRFRAKPASCASSVMHSQFDDAALRMVCAYTDFGCYGQMQTMIAQCVAAVRNSCGAPLTAWRRRVAAIDAAPDAARQECEIARQTVQTSGTRAQTLRAGLAQAEADLANARSAPRADAVSLADAHCGG